MQQILDAAKEIELRNIQTWSLIMNQEKFQTCTSVSRAGNKVNQYRFIFMQLFFFNFQLEPTHIPLILGNQLAGSSMDFDTLVSIYMYHCIANSCSFQLMVEF